MWLKWTPWRFVVRYLARSQGFLDPLQVFSRLSQFSQPSEVLMPTELIRAGAVFHARGLINNQAIQHNLDWVWPYWVVQQFDPRNISFVPRAFSLTHINLTHRNWTAVGRPGSDELPIVDPRGLVTPLFDGWSIDAWIVSESKTKNLLPSRLADAKQTLVMNGDLSIATESSAESFTLTSTARVIEQEHRPACQLHLRGAAAEKAWLVISLRPYNPEGVSFIHQVQRLPGQNGWKVNGKNEVYLSAAPAAYRFSVYSKGDVYHRLFQEEESHQAVCDVGMATAAAVYEISPDRPAEVTVTVPLKNHSHSSLSTWPRELEGHCRLEIPDSLFKFLYDAALHTLIVHSPDDVYPGPYTYKHFWFRDAAFILYALLCTGMTQRAERVLDRFPSRQTPFGYFLSQDGEWDSNGEALWIFHQFCRFTNRKIKKEWKKAIERGARWIKNKRLSDQLDALHAGLLPAGFSAEHLGPNDYYYWDDFWAIAGLRSAAAMLEEIGEQKQAAEFREEAHRLNQAVERTLEAVRKRLGHDTLPSSPYRRMDTGSIGSIVSGYPLQIWSADDPRLIATANYLLENCFVEGGFFHDMSHSGINPYLTLHVAQLLLRAGDPRYFEIIQGVAEIASPTGQWPEAVHPRTRGGCMGDGQHVWAGAEWMIMIRNCFVREEGADRLILCSGIPKEWCGANQKLFFGPAPTAFGVLSITIECAEEKLKVSWEAQWHGQPPSIEIRFPGHQPLKVEADQNSAEIRHEVSVRRA